MPVCQSFESMIPLPADIINRYRGNSSAAPLIIAYKIFYHDVCNNFKSLAIV